MQISEHISKQGSDEWEKIVENSDLLGDLLYYGSVHTDHRLAIAQVTGREGKMQKVNSPEEVHNKGDQCENLEIRDPPHSYY